MFRFVFCHIHRRIPMNCASGSTADEKILFCVFEHLVKENERPRHHRPPAKKKARKQPSSPPSPLRLKKPVLIEQ